MSRPEERGERQTGPEAAEDRAEPGTAGPARGYARMRARDDAARAQLQPLAPGERPLVLTLSAALAALIGIGNIALLVAGYEVSAIEQPSAVEALALPVFMLVLAVGIWLRRYWAMLAFQAVLAVTILFSFLYLLRASNLEAVALSLAVAGVCGALFWHLVKAMARAHMPRQASR